MKASKYDSIIGKKFHKLTAIKREQINRRSVILCQCECGRFTRSCGYALVSGYHKSCRCVRLTRNGFASKKFPLFQVWKAIHRRCYCKNDPAYKDYGARGIKLCKGWMDLQTFYNEMGDKPSKGHSIDRIDNDGNYSCGKCDECLENGWAKNCRWATREEQNKNRRWGIYIEFRGQKKHLSDWAAELGIKRDCLYYRIFRKKWSITKAFTTPLRRKISK